MDIMIKPAPFLTLQGDPGIDCTDLMKQTSAASVAVPPSFTTKPLLKQKVKLGTLEVWLISHDPPPLCAWPSPAAGMQAL